MEDKIKKIFSDNFQSVQPLLDKIEDEKINLVVIRKFTQSMLSKEKNKETQYIYREIISYIDRTIEGLVRVEKELPGKISSATFTIATEIAQLVAAETAKEIGRQTQSNLQNKNS